MFSRLLSSGILLQSPSVLHSHPVSSIPHAAASQNASLVFSRFRRDPLGLQNNVQTPQWSVELLSSTGVGAVRMMHRDLGLNINSAMYLFPYLSCGANSKGTADVFS